MIPPQMIHIVVKRRADFRPVERRRCEDQDQLSFFIGTQDERRRDERTDRLDP